MMKMLGGFLALALLAACSTQQAATFQVKADAASVKIANAVQVGCALDNKFVPIGQDAAAVIAPVVGATNAAAGTLLMAATEADKALVHPSVQAVCKALLGDKAVPAAQGVVVPAVPAPAAVKPTA